MISFLYKFISFFLQHSSSLHASSSLVWKWCERIQYSIKPTGTSQPHRKQISPYQRRDTDIKGTRINRKGCGRSRAGFLQAPAPAADAPSRCGSCLVHHPWELQGSVPSPRARSHLVLPVVQLQEECLPQGPGQKECSTSSGQKRALWGLVAASDASSHHPSPAGL